jgi:intein/homing endonuclease
LYLSGKSLARIQAETGVPHETARLILHRKGIRFRHVHAILHPVVRMLNFEAALLLGLHAGDGHLSDSWGISVGGEDREMLKAVVTLVESILGVEPYIDVRSDNYFIVRSAKDQVRQFFRDYGFPRGKKAGIVRVPEAVMESENPRIWTGFLRGAFSSDGSFWYKRRWGQCRFLVSSPWFRDGFVELAHRLGFEFRSYNYMHNGGDNKLPLHLAYLGTRDEVRRWMESVGSISDTHLRRYSEWKTGIWAE